MGRTKLQKLAYLADLEARKYLGAPVTDFEYRWHHHGPFDSALYDAIDELTAGSWALQEEVQLGPGFIEKRIVDTGEPTYFNFSPGESEALYYVAMRYKKTALRDLLSEVVYQTEPMKLVQRKGEILPMDTVNNTEKDRLGFDLEKVLQAEQEIDTGQYTLVTDFFDELLRKGIKPGETRDH